MYSLVLMAALSTGADTVACGFRCGCHGGYGCSGYSCGGCNGGYGGCHGGYGCYGGGWGGCYGASYGGCWGGCYGSYYGGCYGGWGYYGGCWGCMGGPGAPVMTTPATPTGPAGERIPTAPEKKSSSLEPSARLLVELPADAKLYVDDHLMQTTSERREFRTPALLRGQTYYYVLKAEIVRDGDVVTETKRVLVRAGETVSANFGDMSAAIAGAKKERPLTAQVSGPAGR
jgi:uncharacterized protein (TIGR03000 family)